MLHSHVICIAVVMAFLVEIRAILHNTFDKQMLSTHPWSSLTNEHEYWFVLINCEHANRISVPSSARRLSAYVPGRCCARHRDDWAYTILCYTAQASMSSVGIMSIVLCYVWIYFQWLVSLCCWIEWIITRCTYIYYKRATGVHAV